MTSDLDLYKKLGTLAYDGGKGSAGESMYNLVSKRHGSQVGRFVSLQGKTSGEYFIALYMGGETIDVVVVNTVGTGKSAVYIANIKQYDGRFSEYAKSFLTSNRGSDEQVIILDKASTVEVLKKAAGTAATDLAAQLTGYIEYLES